MKTVINNNPVKKNPVGRPPTGKPTRITLSIVMEPVLLARIEKYAKTAGKSRSSAIEEMCRCGFEKNNR